MMETVSLTFLLDVNLQSSPKISHRHISSRNLKNWKMVEIISKFLNIFFLVMGARAEPT